MPEIKVTTKEATHVWGSPDGKIEMFEVVLDYNGKQVKAKTYSKNISTIGWSGEIEVYDKDGKNGKETFVKQPQKEVYQGRSSGSNNYKRDDSHIKAQWAIGQSIILLTPEKAVENLPTVEALATDLFSMVDRVKSGDSRGVAEEDKDEVITEIPEGNITIEDIDAVFGKDGEPTVEDLQQELPWPPKKD